MYEDGGVADVNQNKSIRYPLEGAAAEVDNAAITWTWIRRFMVIHSWEALR